MKLLAYHLRTKRVSGLNRDNTPKIENILVKLVGILALQKYSKFLTVRGYVKGEPPKIEAVLERISDKQPIKWKELGQKEIAEAQKVVDDLLKPVKGTQKTDYKEAFEDQKAIIDDLHQRLKAVENKPKPGRKANPKPEVNEKRQSDEKF